MLPPTGPPPPNFILFQLNFDVKFPLLRLLLFLIDLKSTIMFIVYIVPMYIHIYIAFRTYNVFMCTYI